MSTAAKPSAANTLKWTDNARPTGPFAQPLPTGCFAQPHPLVNVAIGVTRPEPPTTVATTRSILTVRIGPYDEAGRPTYQSTLERPASEGDSGHMEAHREAFDTEGRRLCLAYLESMAGADSKSVDDAQRAIRDLSPWGELRKLLYVQAPPDGQGRAAQPRSDLVASAKWSLQYENMAAGEGAMPLPSWANVGWSCKNGKWELERMILNFPNEPANPFDSYTLTVWDVAEDGVEQRTERDTEDGEQTREVVVRGVPRSWTSTMDKGTGEEVLKLELGTSRGDLESSDPRFIVARPEAPGDTSCTIQLPNPWFNRWTPTAMAARETEETSRSFCRSARECLQSLLPCI